MLGIKATKTRSFLLVCVMAFAVVPNHAYANISDVNSRKFTKWDFYTYRVSGSIIERKIIAGHTQYGCNPCSWTKSDARQAKNFDSIRLKSFKNIKKFGTKQSAPIKDVQWTTTSNVQSSLKDFYEVLNNQAFRYWSAHFNDTFDYRVFIGTERDEEETKNYLSESEELYSNIQTVSRFYDRYRNLQDYEKERPLGGGMPVRVTSKNDQPKSIHIIYHVGSFTKDVSVFATTPAHEVTHILQINRAKSVGYEMNMPPSLWEGSAVLFGAGIPMTNLAWYSDELDHQLMRFLSNYGNAIPMKTKQDAIALMENAENPKDEMGYEAGYYIGALLFEWIVAQYGVEGFIRLLDNVPASADFDQALAKTFKLSKSQVYEKSANYVLKTYQRVWSVYNR